MIDITQEDGSFRDPAGFLFYDGAGVLHRQINRQYARHYDHLMESGLYEKLTSRGMLIPHEEADAATGNADPYKVIRPRPVPLVSYPYEWSFGQLKRAALAMLDIQKTSMEFGMMLKDATAYNMQFEGASPVMIDTLSFEVYEQDQPWYAYRQFCQHFLAPLALACHRDVRLMQLSRIHIDGIPLDMASGLLPGGTRLSLGMMSHIHAHSKSQKRHQDGGGGGKGGKEAREPRIGKRQLEGVISNLYGTVSKLEWKAGKTEWGDYYSDTNYTDTSFEHKKELVADFVGSVRPKRVWDLGANTGVFSRIAGGDGGIHVASFDIDPVAVEKNYQECTRRGDKNILPLLLDLTNPSPGLGWSGSERKSLAQRGPVDMVLALALVHHLAISNNLPLEKISEFFAGLCTSLVIEFVPKEDSQVQRLLQSRKDIFDRYDKDHFEDAFGGDFEIVRAVPVRGSERTLYLMQRRA